MMPIALTARRVRTAQEARDHLRAWPSQLSTAGRRATSPTSPSAPTAPRFIETRTGWSIKRFVHPYRTIQIRAGQHTRTAEDPLPPDLRDALALIK